MDSTGSRELENTECCLRACKLISKGYTGTSILYLSFRATQVYNIQGEYK